MSAPPRKDAGEQRPRVADCLPSELLSEPVGDELLHVELPDVPQPPLAPVREQVLRRPLRLCEQTPNDIDASGLVVPSLTGRMCSSSFVSASRLVGNSATVLRTTGASKSHVHPGRARAESFFDDRRTALPLGAISQTRTGFMALGGLRFRGSLVASKTVVIGGQRVGTSRFSSSVQLSTTLSRPDPASSLTMTNRWPSGLTS